MRSDASGRVSLHRARAGCAKNIWWIHDFAQFCYRLLKRANHRGVLGNSVDGANNPRRDTAVMLPDLRLVIVAVAVTILVVIKFGSDLASMLSDPYVGSAETPGRRPTGQHMLPENPNQR